jgi:acrylyl-CoA reductase (NADPH)
MPFILRGVRLQGVDSVMCPLEKRKQAWQRLVTDLPLAALEKIGSREVALAEAPQAAADLLDGKVTGRVLVSLKAE